MDTSATNPLIFPPHFPPTTRWKKFFIGVWWLGPDLSFFKELRRQQAARTPGQMEAWGAGRRREVAEWLSQAFQREVRWPAPVFLPNDSFQVMCNGPSFGMLDDLGSLAVIRAFEKHYGVLVPKDFWTGRENPSFGEVVTALMDLTPNDLLELPQMTCNGKDRSI